MFTYSLCHLNFNIRDVKRTQEYPVLRRELKSGIFFFYSIKNFNNQYCRIFNT